MGAFACDPSSSHEETLARYRRELNPLQRGTAGALDLARET